MDRINEALNGLNISQLSGILTDLEVSGRSSLRRKNDKIARIMKISKVSTINDYLKKYGKDLIPTKEIARDVTVTSKRAKKRQSQLRNKLKKESERIRSEIEKLEAERAEKIAKSSKITKGPHRGYKNKKIRKLNRDASNIGIQIEKLTKLLKEIESNPKFQKSIEISQKMKESKKVRKKIEELNKKIRKARGKTKRNLMLKREALKL